MPPAIPIERTTACAPFAPTLAVLPAHSPLSHDSHMLSIRSIVHNDVEQFGLWEKGLNDINKLEEALRLRDGVLDPRVASTEECWLRIWNKPLFSNTKVNIGHSYMEKLRPFMLEAWRFVGVDPEKFIITHDGRGNRAENYSASGLVVSQIRKVSGIAAKRLLGIQGGGNFLRTMVRFNGESAPLAPYAANDFDAMLDQLPRLIAEFRILLGRGWGHITVMHMMTDFGLAVKPDLHLVRTVRHLRLVEGLRDVAVPNEREAILIVTAITRLVQAVYGPSADFANLRYADKVLMDASLEGLVSGIA